MTAILMACLALGSLVGAPVPEETGSAERLAVEPVAYVDSSAAARAWKPGEQSGMAGLATEKTPDGQPALLFPCDMTRAETRFYWDRDVALQLSRYGRITLWMKVVGSRDAIGNFTLYFRSGNGWYSCGFNLHEEGWNRVVLERSGFLPEDAPTGWHAIEGIRLSFWKGADSRADVLVGGIAAHTVDVAVVRNARAGEEHLTWAAKMAALLERAGVEGGTVEDSDVERGALRGKKLAIYPYSASVSEQEAAELRAFVAAGGRVIACYGLPAPLASLLQIENAGYARAEPAGRFSQMRATASAPRGMPKVTKQSSWNISRARPVTGRSRTVAEWFDKDGRPTGEPAVLLSDSGAFVTHVLLEDDMANKVRLVRALIGALAPEVWRSSAQRVVEDAGTLRPRWKSAQDTLRGLREIAKSFGPAPPELRQGERALEAARSALKGGDFELATERAAAIRPLLERAYARMQTSKPGEYRAVWCHSAFGVDGFSWDQAIQRLARNGFTAIMPNMLWGGLAYYRSRVLPVDPSVETRGDQIEICLRAARRHGIEVHVWKVNFNLDTAPREFVDRMRSEGRLQKDSAGKEVAWLCPSHPANLALERDSLEEVARNYAVDGIQLDYIRYPHGMACYCGGCRERFEQRLGRRLTEWPADVLRRGAHHAEYLQFRRYNINQVVQAVAEAARKARPGIKISAAVWANWPVCRDEIGQDWALWVRNGWLDFVCPMSYTDSNTQFRTMVRLHRQTVDGRIPLVSGIGASAPGLEPCQVIDQVRIARSEGANGFILFNYDARTISEHIPLLGMGMTRNTARTKAR